MGNCLVTKLKAIVDNPDLLKLGECRIKVKNVGNVVGKLYINCSNRQGETDTITFDHAIPYYQNNVLKEASTIINLIDGSEMQWQLEPGEEVMAYFTNKYGLYYINDDNKSFELTFIGVDCMPNGINEISIRRSQLKNIINIGDFCGINTIILTLGGSNNHDYIVGSIDKLANASDLTTLGLSYCTEITGNVENLASALNISSLEFRNVPLHGSLNALFDAWAAAGKTGSMLLTFSGSQCTLTGVTTYDDNRVTFSNGSWTVSDWNVPQA